MQTLDLRKELKHLYNPSAKKVEIVDVPAFNFAMIDGAIEPGQSPGTSPRFQEDMQALYGIAYTLKFMLKMRKEDPIDFPVMALEGLWWVEDGEFNISKPGNWKYTLMILLPDVIKPNVFEHGMAQLRKKKPGAAIERLRLDRFFEGLSIQTMHIGPYASEPETIAKMEAFALANGLELQKKHHEIYMSDPRRTAPEKLKTVLRHAVRRI